MRLAATLIAKTGIAKTGIVKTEITRTAIAPQRKRTPATVTGSGTKTLAGSPEESDVAPRSQTVQIQKKISPSLMPKRPAMAKTAGLTLFPRQHQQMRSAAMLSGSTEPRATASLFGNQAKKSLSTSAALYLKRRVSAARCEMVRPSPLSSLNMIRVCRQTE